MIAIAPLRKQTGDTIVEVLIAIAIVSLILAGAYASTNRNVATTQDTQEHGQALQLVQSQVEFLRASRISGAPSNGCFKNDGTQATAATDCKVTTGGSPNCSVDPCYDLKVTNTSGTVYSVSAKWSTLTGTTANVTVYYER